jgi:hypothetical protein
MDRGAVEERFVVNDSPATWEFILNDRNGYTWQDCGFICDNATVQNQGSLRCFRQL